MLERIDHVVIAVRDIERGAEAYTTLLGMTPVERRTEGGVAVAVFALSNVAVELMAPVGAGGERLQAAIDDSGEGLKSLVFAARDIAAAHRRAERVGLAPEAIADNALGWRSFRLDTALTHGVRVFCIERTEPLASAPGAVVTGLDHVVIRSGDMERAAALYGARLGLDMRLDRVVMGRRLMFFRCGDAVVEIAENSGAKDALWGLSWRVADAETARGRLAAAGVAVSEVRAGMKPGTRVFTVRDGAAGVPTLMLEAGARRD